jgi:hypothetical protein
MTPTISVASGPYLLLGTPADYGRALRTANRMGTVQP